VNSLRLTKLICFLFAILVVSSSALAQKKHQLKFEPFLVEFDSQTFTSIYITGPKAKDLTPFEVENPRRLVLDLPRKIGKFLKESNYILNNSSCSKSIRIGGHPDKTRVVIDLNSNCDFQITKKPNGLKIDFTVTNQQKNNVPPGSSVTPTTTPKAVTTNTAIPSPTISASPVPATVATALVSATPTTVAMVTKIQSDTPTATTTPTRTPTASPTVTATSTSTATYTSTPEAQEAIATSIPSATPTNTIQALLVGKVLEQISFFHDGDINQVKLGFSQRVSFKTVKDSTRKYKISIKDCLIARPGLTLPHFPPNDVVGFTLIQAVKEGADLNIYINVEDGIKINAANIDNSIVINSEPAGF
jgi:hypothetical protein